MSMHKNFMDILNVLYFDETLLRLIYYPAKSLKGNVKDPLDVSLTNVLEIDTDWSIRNSRIMKTAKTDDLNPDKPMIRLFVYAGRRVPESGNYAIANQSVIIDVLVHNSFEEADLRSSRIGDRLNELFVSERVTGIGKMYYQNGSPIGSPSGYVGYQHMYTIGSTTK
jgi:hypothetical protein